MFESRFLVRSTQVDQLGHLNNAAYLEIYEWARWEWALSRGLGPVDMVERLGIGPAIVHIDLDFDLELRLHEDILVRTWMEEAGRRKAVIGQEMVKADGRTASSVRVTFVLMDLKSRRSIPLPEPFRAAHAEDEAFRAARAGDGGRRRRR